MEVHPGLVVGDRLTRGQLAPERRLDRDAEVEGDVRSGGKVVDVPDPVGVAPPGRVPDERGVDVPVADDDVSRPQGRKDVPLEPVGEIGGV